MTNAPDRAYREYEWKSDFSYGVQVVYPVLRAMLDPARERTILDLGCGNGALARRLSGEGFEVWGIDASESGIARANGHMPGRFFVADLAEQRLPEPLSGVRFDAAISTEVIEHLYDPHQLLRLAHTVLAPVGGAFFLTTPYHGYLKNLVVAATGKFDWHVDARTTGGHIKFWSRRSLGRALGDAGFRVTAFRGAGRLPYLWKSMVVRAEPTAVSR